MKSTNSQRTYVSVAIRWAGHRVARATETEPDQRAHIKRSAPRAPRVGDLLESQVFGAGADRKWEPRVKTDSSRRPVPRPPPAADILRERPEAARAARAEGTLDGVGAKFVFPAQMGGVLDLVTTMKAVRRTVDRAGFPWATFHTLRRTVERQLLDADADPRVIMAVMGHDSATSWSAYVDRNVDASGVAGLLR